MRQSWGEASSAHRRVVEAFTRRAREIPAARWEAPIAPGKWSPAQVAEHLRLSYVVVARELAGGAGLRKRAPGWLRPLLRFRYLRGILREGRVPEGARAPSEIRPGEGPFERAATLEALGAAAAAFEQALGARWESRGAVLTHHIFGGLDAPDGLRFVVVHTEHHARQLPG